MKKIHIALLGITTLSTLVLSVVFSQHAEAWNATDGWRYVYNDDAGATMAMRAKQLETGQDVSRNTVAYAPSQFFVVSDTPAYRFQIKGRYNSPNTSNVYYELYQLRGSSDGNGCDTGGCTPNGGIRLGSIAARNDNLYTTATYSGSAGSPGVLNNVRGVDANLPFVSSELPRYNGKYVFLLKIVHMDDRQNGFAKDFSQTLTQFGCPQGPGAGYISCAAVVGNQKNGITIANYEYSVRVDASINQITSAPATIAFGITAGGARSEFDYSGLRLVNSRSDLCRTDTAPDGSPRGVLNADWDSAAYYNSIGQYGFGDGSQGGYPDWSGPDGNIYATLKNITTNSATYTANDTDQISGSWKNGIWRIPLSPVGPTGSANSKDIIEMNVLNWNRDNFLYIGGAEFTYPPTSTSGLPQCGGNLHIFKYNDANQNGAYDGGDSPVGGISFRIDPGFGTPYSRTTGSNGRINLDGIPSGTYTVTESGGYGYQILSPNPQSAYVGDGNTANLTFRNFKDTSCELIGATSANNDTGVQILTPLGNNCYRYNGSDARSTRNIITQAYVLGSSAKPYMKSARRVDSNPTVYDGYRTAFANQLTNADTYNLSPGQHTFYYCGTSSRWPVSQSQMVELKRYKAPGSNDARYYYSTDGSSPSSWIDAGSEGYLFTVNWVGNMNAIHRYSNTFTGSGGTQITRYVLRTSSPGAGWSDQGLLGYTFAGSGTDRAELREWWDNNRSGTTAGGSTYTANLYAYTSSPPFSVAGYVDSNLSLGYVATTNNVPTDTVSATGGHWACAQSDFVVNGPPVTTAVSPPSGTQINYNCPVGPPMTVSVTDPDGVQEQLVRSTFYVSVNGGGYTGFVTSPKFLPYGGSVNFTGDEAFSGGTSLTTWLQNNVPGGSTVSWYAQSEDMTGVSDLNSVDRIFASPFIRSDLRQIATNYALGPASAVNTVYKRTPANITSTKQYYDLTTNAPITGTRNISDGETVKARLTITNNGQTPTQYYTVRDYLGYIRDFEQPRNFVLESAGNVPISPNVTPVKTAAGDTAIANPNDINTAWDGSWKIDFGSNNGANGLPNGELAPGGSVTISYVVRADRNMTDRIKAAQGGAYNESNASNPNNSFNSSANDIVISTQASQTKVDFTQNYCSNAITSYDSGNVAQNVVTPTFQGVRGDINSNSSIYASGNKANATFVVTATGSIAQAFGGGSPYNGAGNTTATNCSVNGGVQTTGGINWRSDLTKNMLQLMAGSVNNSTNGFNANLFNPGAGNPNRGVLSPGGGSNVWVHTGDLNISVDPQFTGVGTIIVKGNLNIRSNMNYKAGAAGLSSVGFVVFGNITVDKSVTHLVGSYYSSDVLINAVGNTNCPNVTNSQGLISTGRSNQQLVVEGLMVARQFNLERYYTNTSPSAAATPAELVYYDGRVIAATPPGFSTFSSSSQWTELLP